MKYEITAKHDSDRVDPAKADQARSLVSGGSAQAKAKCHECGAPSHGYYRCYYCSLEYDRYVLGGDLINNDDD